MEKLLIKAVLYTPTRIGNVISHKSVSCTYIYIPRFTRSNHAIVHYGCNIWHIDQIELHADIPWVCLFQAASWRGACYWRDNPMALNEFWYNAAMVPSKEYFSVRYLCRGDLQQLEPLNQSGLEKGKMSCNLAAVYVLKMIMMILYSLSLILTPQAWIYCACFSEDS